MHYGELPALHTKEKCVYTVYVCVCELMKKKRLSVSCVRAGWPASLSREVLPLINNQGQT